MIKALCACLLLAGIASAQTTTTLPLIAKPTSLTFRQTGPTAPASQTINVVAKKGTLGALTATATGGTWLSATSSGTTVTVSVATAGMAAGKYSGSVSISATGFTTLSVGVSLTIVGDSVVVFPSTLNQTVIAGGEANPKPPAIDIWDVNGSPFSWVAVGDQSWLVLTQAAGSGKGAITVGVNPASLTAGTYTGHVTITDTANQSKATVTVNVTANAPQPVNFQLGPYLNSPGVLNFVTDSASKSPAPKIFYGRNLGGGGSLNFTLSGTVNSPTGGSWLSFSPKTNKTPGMTTVTVNPAGLAPGDYSATITGTATAPVGSSGGNLTGQLQVYLKVLSGPGVSVDKKFLRFTSSAKISPPQPSPLSQTITFLTDSTTGFPFTATATTAAGGNWLDLSATSGTATSGSTLSVSVDPTVIAGLSPGFYTGDVTINFGGGSSVAQRTVGVGLRIFTTTDSPNLSISPGGLSFVGAAGGANPASKSLKIRAVSAATAGLNYTITSAVSTPTGGTWLSVGSTSGTATSTAATIPVGVNTTGLAAGVYKGAITFTPDPTTNAPVQIVNVNLIVGPSGSKPTGNSISLQSHATPGVIASGAMVAIITDPADSFTWTTDSAMVVDVTLNDAAGNAVPGATVILSSSNGEPDLTMEDTGTGVYVGMFQPAVSGPITLSVAANAMDSTGATFSSTLTSVSGDIIDAADVATPVYTNGAVGAASYAPQPTPITPGSIIALFGVNIAGSGGSASTIPLPSTLGIGTPATVTIGGFPAALFGAYPSSVPGGLDQINLQIPFELDGQPTADIVVTTGGVAGAPQTVPIGTAPALFTQNLAGTGDGLFVHSDGVTLVTPTAPATTGETIVMYATGLGDTAANPADGTGATGSDALTTTLRVTIGGQPATVAYAGLVPTLVGFYQVNVTVPAGLPSGENNVIVFVNGVPATGQATVALH